MDNEKTAYGTRHRVSFKQSTKDKITCDITVEMIDTDKDIVLKEAGDLLVSALVVAKERSL